MAAAPRTHRVSTGQNHLPREQSLVPVGMATILPEAAHRVRNLESQLLSHIHQWGYDEIILPTFEYLDVLAPGLEPQLIENCYKIVDRATGRILLLRPDATAQIARTVAMGMMGTRLPLRLSYRATVFRYEPEHAGRDREILQVGAELIGADDPSADCEIIALLIECLLKIGLSGFRVSLGYVGFFKGLLIRAGLSSDGQKRAEHAAARKDLPHLEEILLAEQVQKTSAKAILAAPELCGQGEILTKGRKLAGDDKPLVRALDRLTTVYQLLCSAGYEERLLLDLGEFREFDYYDGIVFDVFAEGIGVELGGGGRYDHLIGRFGRNIPSTGFALNVDRLFRGLNRSRTATPPQSAVLVVASSRAMESLMTVTTVLRQSGVRVIQQIVSGVGKGVLDMAVEAGVAVGAEFIVVIGSETLEQDRLVLLESDESSRAGKSIARGRMRRSALSISELVAQIRRKTVPTEGL